MKKAMLIVGCLLAECLLAGISVAGEKDLASELRALDREFFERSFNQCDGTYLADHVDPGLTFYHDQSGIQNLSQFRENTARFICNEHEAKPLRRLIPGSLETDPLYRDGQLYGAIQRGKHAFYLRDADQVETLTSTASFTHTWLKQEEGWKLAHVLSYAHHSPGPRDSRLLEVMTKAGVPALAFARIEAGKVRESRVLGTLDGSTPAPPDTLFKVASLTKPIITMTVLKLVHAGRLSLDEPIAQYWIDPDIRHDDRVRALTARHVLMHRTGFPNWRWMSGNGELAFAFTPGEGHAYSGEGYEYLRRSLEAKFGVSVEALAEQMVFTPAGMRDTHFYWDEGVALERYARHYRADGTEYELEPHREANAAANMITTIDDYARFLTFVLNQQHLMPTLFNAMTTREQTLGSNHYFGLGWEIFDAFSTGEPALLHSGRDPGVNTLAVLFPESSKAYVVFMNADNAMPVLEELLPGLYLGRDLLARQ
ncbi:MAG: serine hydrolase domain-containing protein [Pseudomonadota bacterium]